MQLIHLQKARDAYRQGDFNQALSLYSLLKNELATDFFDINITLCKKRLAECKPSFLCILDEISYHSWEDSLHLEQLFIDNFASQIERNGANLFLESAWHGVNNQWDGAFISENETMAKKRLFDLITLAKKRNRKIIFWNKEDPLHFDKFLPIAAMADVIFTTDSNMLPKYRERFPDKAIACLPFSVNVKICNPINRYKIEQRSLCFSGSNYRYGHNDRSLQMRTLLPLIIRFNGVIFDRMSEQHSERFKYPQEYNPFIKPSIPYSKMVEEYRKFKFFLNVNTITDSPTMLARRVYELLACGTPVISWPSKALETQFPGIVQLTDNTNDAARIFEEYQCDEEKWRRLSQLGVREVMDKHTNNNYINVITEFGNTGLKNSGPKVSIIMASMRPQNINHFVQCIDCQNYDNYEFIICAQNFNDTDIQKLENMLKAIKKEAFRYKILRDDSRKPLGARLNSCVSETRGDYIAKFDDDDFYFPNYLSDMLLPFKFSDAVVAGKHECYMYLAEIDQTYLAFPGHSHEYSDFLHGPTLVFKRDVFNELKFKELNKGEDSGILADIQGKGWQAYSADRYNFFYFRGGAQSGHTFSPPLAHFTNLGSFVSKGFRKDLAEL